MTANGSPAPRPAAAGGPRRRSGLDGAALPGQAWLLLAAGTGGGLLFTGAYLAEGATRAGYSPLVQPISALSLGPGGWAQQLNFALFGVLMAVSAAGWRMVLAGGRGAVWFPLLRCLAGLGLVMDGLLAQDPDPGYPPGARTEAPTLHGQLHTLFAVVTILALAASCFALARRFAAEPGWRRWAVFTAATGVATIVFIAAFGAAGGHGGLAGLYERLAGGVNSLLGLAVLARLAADVLAAGRGSKPRPAGAGP
jgi:hypothetical protein